MYIKPNMKVLKSKYVKPVFIASGAGTGGPCGCQGSY